MPKFSLVLILALLAGTFFAATADARGGGGRDVYLLYVKPYKDAQAKKARESAERAARPARVPGASAQSRAERRARAQAEAAAQARAAARAREIAAQRAATAKANVAKASVDKDETLVPKTDAPKTDAAKTEASKSEVLKADDDAPPLAKADLETPATTAVTSAPGPKTCRKYSAAVGGMIDGACGE